MLTTAGHGATPGDALIEKPLQRGAGGGPLVWLAQARAALFAVLHSLSVGFGLSRQVGTALLLVRALQASLWRPFIFCTVVAVA
jgi:hypothetical protein